MNYLKHQKYKKKHLSNTQKNRFLKIKNSPLELEKYYKPIIVSIDDTDKFEEKEIIIIKKRNLTKKHLVQLVQLVN